MSNTGESRNPAETRPRSRLKRVAGRAMLLFGGLIVGLAAAECILRVVGFSEPQFYVPDRYIGTHLKPGFTGIWTREGRASLQINSAGFRDREHSFKKPEGTFRIAVLGDSYVEALQVPFEETFCAVLESELADCAALRQKRVEVLNFGISGFGTGQQLLTLRHYVWDYEPDMVIVLMCPHNDITDNSRRLTASVVRPFFSLKGDRLVLDNSFREHPAYLYAARKSTQWKVAWINRSRVLQLYCRIRHRAERKRSGDAASRDDVENICYFEPTIPSWRAAWTLTERLVAQIHKEVQQRGARFCLVVGTNSIQVDPRQAVRTSFMKQLGVADLYYFDRRMQAVARKGRFEVVCLAEPMMQYAQRRDVFLHGFPNTQLGWGHWNSDGHRVAAKLVAKTICRNLKSAPRSVSSHP